MSDFEKLGVFYLGRRFDPAAGAATDEPLLYDAKDLTTHAVCLGMTGSGKTGLCVGLLEEAAIDGIPAIAIDPKGDLANLLLAFPELRPQDFRPWIDEAEAARQGVAPDAFAQQTAEAWRKGLADWGQDATRIARLKAAAEFAVYTPGSASGRPLAVLRSLAAPSPEFAADGTALRDRILSAVSGLLGLLGIEADPVRSREHILLSSVLDHAWRGGRDLDLAGLIRDVQKPPFEKVGVFDLESFFPAADRLGLAMALNNLLASPGFGAWMEGEALDVQRLLYTPEGRPRVAVLSIAHLSDAERMFFVTILLNEVLAWMRAQSGTGSLRAILYMDEIFGYFPPTANPPSKTPMLTLLKQARAYGLGVVLATQNPVDLDYKGLSNAGTWLIGRLQTERDKARVLDGLEGVLAAQGGFDRAATERLLAALGKRVFLMRNVHEDAPVLLQSRWTMSYLRGPLTLAQLRGLCAPAAAPAAAPAPALAAAPPAAPAPATAPAATAPSVPPGPSAAKPAAPAGVTEQFLAPARPAEGELLYRAAAAGVARLHFVDAETDTDVWQDVSILAAPSDDGREVLWAEGDRAGSLKERLERVPRPGAKFGDLPGAFGVPRNYAAWQKGLGDYLYQNVTLDLVRCPALKLVSKPGEAEGDFRARVQQAFRERRDAEVEALRKKYAPKIAVLEDRARRADERVEREKAQYGQQKVQTAIAFGATLLGAFLGRKTMSVGNVSRAATTMRSASRIGREKEDVGRAEESGAVVRERLAALQKEFEDEVARLQGEADSARLEFVPVQVRPRKSDIATAPVALAWLPWRTGADGMPEPVYR